MMPVSASIYVLGCSAHRAPSAGFSLSFWPLCLLWGQGAGWRLTCLAHSWSFSLRLSAPGPWVLVACTALHVPHRGALGELLFLVHALSRSVISLSSRDPPTLYCRQGGGVLEMKLGRTAGKDRS